MKKILIIGAGGAGKTTLARRMGDRLGIEVIHLDAVYWQPGWVEPPRSEWLRMVDELLARDSWIMDGNYSGTLDRRMEACDTVIFLDLPGWICVWRILRRLARHYGKTRPDVAAGCDERFSLEFIGWVWNYSRRKRPKILARLDAVADRKTIIRLRSAGEVERFVSSLA